MHSAYYALCMHVCIHTFAHLHIGLCMQYYRIGLHLSKRISYIPGHLFCFTECVFSDEHHTARASRMTNISGSRSQTALSLNKVDRVPYYLLLKKLIQSRDDGADDLHVHIDTLQERLANN